jgi:hypothetical protein
MARTFPVNFVWRQVDIIDGDGVAVRRMAMVPLARYANVAARQYHEGEEYPLVPLEARSRASHNFYFASIHEGFQNLPEKIAARWPTEEALRHWILIETGWFEEDEFVFDSEAEAKAAMPKIRKRHVYARIMRKGSTLFVRYAKSQSAAAMGKAEFDASRKDVLELLDHMVGVPRGELKRQAGRSG